FTRVSKSCVNVIESTLWLLLCARIECDTMLTASGVVDYIMGVHSTHVLLSCSRQILSPLTCIADVVLPKWRSHRGSACSIYRPREPLFDLENCRTWCRRGL